MSEENKAIVQRYIEEVYNKGNVNLVDELVAADYVNRGGLSDQRPGSEGLKQFIPQLRTIFPDEHLTLENLIAEGDMVAYRWIARGTHNAEMMGVPPTGKQMIGTGISIVRIADGKIAEEWTSRNDLSIMQQLGVIPPDTE